MHINFEAPQKTLYSAVLVSFWDASYSKMYTVTEVSKSLPGLKPRVRFNETEVWKDRTMVNWIRCCPWLLKSIIFVRFLLDSWIKNNNWFVPSNRKIFQVDASNTVLALSLSYITKTKHTIPSSLHSDPNETAKDLHRSSPKCQLSKQLNFHRVQWQLEISVYM